MIVVRRKAGWETLNASPAAFLTVLVKVKIERAQSLEETCDACVSPGTIPWALFLEHKDDAFKLDAEVDLKHFAVRILLPEIAYCLIRQESWEGT